VWSVGNDGSTEELVAELYGGESREVNSMTDPRIAKKLVTTLRRLAQFTGEGRMYPGDWWDGAPKQYEKLRQMGFVREYIPHNPVHKSRAVITVQGLEFISGGKSDD